MVEVVVAFFVVGFCFLAHLWRSKPSPSRRGTTTSRIVIKLWGRDKSQMKFSFTAFMYHIPTLKTIFDGV